MYQQELTRSGEFLFKIRGKFLKRLVIITVVIAYFNEQLGPFVSDTANQMWFIGALAVAWSGAIVRFFTSGYAALGTSGVNKVAAIASELNTTGPYSIVRNPLYLGRILNFTGIAMLSGSLLFAVIIFFLSVLIYERISIYEEEFLYKEFGKDVHAEWAKEVPFLMPRFHGWKKPKYPFWIRRCIKREEKKVKYLITATALSIFAHSGFDYTQFPNGSIWYYVWIVAMLVYFFSRGLRRFTKVYDGIS